jgi:hypothetical protein
LISVSAVASLAKSLLAGKSALLSGLAAGIFGFASESSGFIPENGNKLFFVALCALAGAFIGVIPRIMMAWFNHRASERDFVGKEMRELIAFLKKSAEDNDRILDLATTVRHTIQESYQTAVWHINYLESQLREKGVTNFPSVQTLDVAVLLRNMDEEIKAIKNRKPDPS